MTVLPLADGLPSTSEQPLSTKDTSVAGKRPEAPPNIASLRQQARNPDSLFPEAHAAFPQIESLKIQNAKLERIYDTESKRSQEQATSDKLRIESLIKQTALLEGQLTTTQKSHADLSMIVF
jgi:hypothetical protein